jgi:hypothetical protein
MVLYNPFRLDEEPGGISKASLKVMGCNPTIKFDFGSLAVSYSSANQKMSSGSVNA